MAKPLECVHSGLDLFESPGLQTAIEHGEYVEYRPLAALDDGPIEFSIKGGAEYLDLANTFLRVKAKITQANGDALAEDAAVLPINLLLHTMFSDVSMFLNGVQVTTPSGAYGYQSYWQTLLTYSPDVKESQLEAAMYYADTPTHFDVVSGNANKGGKRRRQRAAKSDMLDMMGRLHLDLFHQSKYLLNHLDMRIKLTRAKPEFVLMAEKVGANFPNYKLVITDAGLFVRKVTVSPMIALAHARTLEKANAVYPLTRTLMRVFSVANGSFSFTADNMFMDKIPNRVIVGFVRGDAYNGDLGHNPLMLEHMSLNYISLHHQGSQIPAKGLRPNFETGEYARSYMTLFTGTNSAWSDVTSGLTMWDYANGYTLFCFDLTPSLVHSHTAFEVSKAGPLRLECQFAEALQRPYNLIVYAETDGRVEITKTREVLVL